MKDGLVKEGTAMTPPEAEAAARRIDELLGQLRADPRAAAVAEDLTACLVRLYGDGLARIAALLGPEGVLPLCADPLVESLLLVHDLHPVPAETRIRDALRSLEPRLGELTYLGTAGGVARVRLGGAPRCASSRQAALAEVGTTVRNAAPELADVVVEVPAPAPALLQVSLRPGLGRTTA